MSQTLQLPNYTTLNIAETCQLSADITAGVTSLPVTFSDGFADGDHLLLGTYGAESAEHGTINAVPSATAITTDSATTKPHNRYEQVTKLFGNQLKIYRATNTDGTQPADGSFSLLAAVDIDFDQIDTKYTDANGSDAYWYKFTYFNTDTSDETALSSSGAKRGGNYGNYCSIEAIRHQAGLINNQYVSDSQIDEKRQAAQSEINGMLSGLYTLPFADPVPAKIAEITTRLAAGLVLTHPWGGRFVSTNSEGDNMLKQARVDLLAIKEKQQAIVDASGTDLSIGNVGGFSMFPNANSANLSPEEGGRKFTSADRY